MTAQRQPFRAEPTPAAGNDPGMIRAPSDNDALSPVEAALVLMLREIARNRTAERARRRATLSLVEDPHG